MPEDVSQDMEAYFQNLKERSRNAHEIAQEAREQGYDPEGNVEIQLAENLAERVVGLISAEAPQIVDSGAMKRIMELEEEYAPLDWRVPLKIAYEVAEEKFCEFEDKHRAMEIGIRTGFAYQTAGIVSAPLEGFTDLEIKKRKDGEGEYFCLHYAGPVRAAGGTAASVSVLIADYVRKKMGYEKYDPTDKEVKRCPAELEDYHEYVTNLQYYPSKEESMFLVENLPVEISGDASEKYELSNANLKDLNRIPANRLRSGYCLIHSSCIPLKAKKMWKRLDKWGDEMDMEQWNFLEEFLEIQKKARSGDDSDEDEEKDAKIQPNYTYIKDLVGGRPVFGHPMEQGGLRLRYGRGRNTGFNSQAVHPATMRISNEFLAVGTQLKTERPGKAASYNSVDTVDGPIVKLENGDVYELDSDEKAKKVEKDIEEILYFGDVLVSYGDFVEQAHELVPPGYCEEIWIKQLEKNADMEEIDDIIGEQKRKDLFENPLTHDIRYDEAKALSDSFDIPLHPKYTYFYKALDKEKLETLRNCLASAKDVNENVCIIKDKACKRSLELIGIPHKVKKGKIIVKKDKLYAVRDTLQIGNDYTYDEDVLETINKHSPYPIEDKAGTFIGTRMGRPEKAKMRELKGSPHVLFPVGEEGGRLRSFQSAMDEGHITANMQMFECPECERETPFKVCEKCESRTKELRFNRDGERDDEGDLKYKRNELRIAEAMRDMRNRHSIRLIPDLVKGVRGTSNKQHKSEYLAKGILRAKHGITVNKDGTVRYDCSELALTHFKPKEISTSIQRLKELGYEKDIRGEELEDEDQILELKIQDIVLPSCDDAVDEPADTVIENTANFVDEELEKIYDMDPYYDVKDKDDLAGILAVGLAPHTSAGTLTRIIGFSNTQGFYGHPYIHAAMRRDCDGDESCIALLMDAFLNFSREYLPQQRGSTMDAPLVLTSRVISTEVDDQIFDLDVVDEYPLEMYEAAKEYKMPWEVDIETIEDRIGNPNQYEDIGFTHDTSDINGGVVCSSYKTLPSMGEKVEEQMDVAVKLRSVDQTDVAKLVIDRHFLRDTKGNLKKFSMQQFRCVQCNTKYRRPPLNGKCNECDGKIIFTISEGSITKYMDYSLMLADKYDIDTYTRQVLNLTKVRIEGVFGKEKEKQTGLDTFMSS